MGFGLEKHYQKRLLCIRITYCMMFGAGMDGVWTGEERIPGERAPLPVSKVELELLGTLRPYLRQAGDDLRPPWFLPGRKLLDYLLVGVGSGEGIFTVGEETFPVGKWDLVWVPPNTFHEMRGCSRQMRCTYIHFDLLHDVSAYDWDACIPGGTLDLSEFRHLMHPAKVHPAMDAWRGKLKLSNAPAVHSALREICAERTRGAAFFRLMSSGMILSLLALMIRGMETDSEDAPPSASVRVRGAAARIAEACEGKLDMADLAAEQSLSASHFRRLFKGAYGESPRDAALKAKMRHACELLVYSGLNVSEVASRLGYSNVHNFSRAFSKAVGLSPGAYRKGR